MSRIGIVRPLKERDFAHFWLGWTVSLVGDGFFLVAIAWQVFDLWNSPTALALVGVAESIPIVALLLAVARRRSDRAPPAAYHLHVCGLDDRLAADRRVHGCHEAGALA